ncbi:MAG: sulfatase-like hydrolase/transferase [Oscillospiraceae bacterium]|nr:sulfatase-like hydrolase/transferase [Oscillospiraceae bacterium]
MKHWLFWKEKDVLWPQKKLKWYAAWRLLALLAVSVCWGLALLVASQGSYPLQNLKTFVETPLLAVMNVIPVVFLSLLFYAALARALPAFALSGGIWLGFTLTNYYLLRFRDDPLMALDLLDFFTAMHFKNQYDLMPENRLWAVLGCFVVALLFLGIFARGKGAGKRLRLTILAILLLSAYPLGLLYVSDEVYEEKMANFNHFSPWSDTQQYLARGFVYSFLHSVPDLIPSEPQGYDAAHEGGILESFTETDIPANKKVNFLSIQLEAFADFSTMGMDGVDFSLYNDYHALEQESYTGDLITNIFAGGTVDTERCVLTGSAQLEKNYRKNTNSYAWWLRQQGYTVHGSHPCFHSFYNRVNINRYLGFEDYRYYDDYYLQRVDGGLTTDDILFPEILMWMQQSIAETGKPCFSYNVSYQNHGPYDATASEKNYVTGNVSEESRHILNNYLYNVEDTIGAITQLVEELRVWDEPVVLLLFGDHKPWLGYGNSVYQEFSVDFELSSPAGLRNYYGTRYLIWANDAAKAALGKDFVGNGPAISSNFLLGEVFSLCGIRGPAMMQYAEQIRQTLPVLTSTGYYLKDGTVRTELSATEETALAEYTRVSYYWRNEFLYEKMN